MPQPVETAANSLAIAGQGFGKQGFNLVYSGIRSYHRQEEYYYYSGK
jgi:hypothetical protein